MLTSLGQPLWSGTTLGTMQIDTLSDGTLTLPGDFIFGPMPQDELAPILKDYGQDRDALTPECNLTLVRQEDRVILFDVGSGADFMPTAGKLLDALDAKGLAPEDITHVVFTHGHPDHIWGLLDEFDDPMFYEAEVLIGQTEFDYWMNDDTVTTIGEARAAFAVGAKRRLEAIADQVTLIQPDREILPGIYAHASPGHTPGHMAYELRDSGKSLMVVGDAIGNHHIAFARPGWESGSDQDPAMAAQTRQRLFDQITTDDMGLIGFHLPNGGMGQVVTASGAYRFEEWDR
ncbi:MBL fold metallo-hydrolase [Primorskyibacter sp. S187A]|uniref:MBL fold metallo-hydrolase n=1 Tax=Primorskyibacter sp. S187A TaxID=3415130 RepID=UPI003C7A824F